jgi:hypothetical protein
MVFIHLASADVGWFFRYEAYLIASGIVVLALTYHDMLAHLSSVRAPFKRADYWTVLGMLACIPFAVRGMETWSGAPRAVANIYEQQIQMARFIGAYYPGSAIALNDIGAVSFFTDAKVVDLWGLADREVARARLADAYNPTVMAREVARNHARIALVYDAWFYQFGGVPSNWTEIGRWRIDDLYIGGADTITIYATDPGEVAYLRASLQAFSACLPRSVQQTGSYIGSGAPLAHTCPSF